MKIGGVRGGQVFTLSGRTIGTWSPDGTVTHRGQLPHPESGVDTLKNWSRNSPLIRTLLSQVVGHFPTGNLWPVGRQSLIATNTQWVYYSADDGRSWEAVHRLPDHSGPMGTLPTAFTELNGNLYLAEYPLHSSPARIIESTDGGETWEPYCIHESACHFHGVYNDPFGERLWATTGDDDATSAIGYIDNGEFFPIGYGSQQWRAVDLAFTPTSIIWGMDAPYTERIAVLRLRRDDLNGANPTPEVVTYTDQAVFYATTTVQHDAYWVVLSTAAESVKDTYVADIDRYQPTPVARVLAASSASDFQEWYVMESYRRNGSLGRWTNYIPEAGAYIFLETGPDGTILLNPYNTARDHGTIQQMNLPTVEHGRVQKPTITITETVAD